MAKGKQTAEGKRRKGTKAATAVDQQADASAALRRTPRAVRPPNRGPQVLTAAARR
ncbi:hypothetical protein FRC08_004359 [Ceratobasidium sp. 394]|nr:hypothetical protein FRC08_004359 [Ceratobasidium sp. 394]